MTITLGLWAVPTIITVALWAAVILWPIENSGGYYNFGPALDAVLHLAVGVFGTLVVWLVYFIALSIVGG